MGYAIQFSPNGLLPYVDYAFPVNNAWTPGFFQSEHGYAIRKCARYIARHQVTDNACVEFATCISPGDSGGPLFGWFNEGPCVGVCVIGVVSGSGCLGVDDEDTTRRCGNFAAGGIDMANLIHDMRAEYP